MRHVYLDSQSSTPVLPEVFEAMRPFFTEAFGNPSSLHQHGLRARDAMAEARAKIARFINAESPDDIIFTSDGTESSNLAMKGAARANQRKGRHLIISATEHPSVINSAEALAKQGFTCTRLKVNHEGFVDPKELQSAISDETILIAVHHANHDIGAIQPIREIGRIAADAGVPLYVDADASAGWLPLDIQEVRASILSFSPHRFYGPKGVGVLYRNRRARLLPILHGGEQENGRRAGVENVPAIVGAGVAAEIAQRDLSARATHAGRLQKMLWDGLRERIPEVHLNGPPLGSTRLPTNLNLSFQKIEGEGLLLLCDMQGIALAAGTSCISKNLSIAPVLRAIGLPTDLAQGSVILSLGKDNTEADIHYVLEVIPKLVEKLRKMSPDFNRS